MTWSIGNRNIRFKKRHSFSLLELLIVVVIIGSLLAISLPRFRNTFNNLKFDNFCQNLISRMRYLQERASIEQSTYRLNFDLKDETVKITIKQEASGKFSNAKGLLG